MQTLRRLVRFCLGLEALGLVGTISLFFATLVALRAQMAEDEVSPLTIIFAAGIPLVTATLNAVPAIAWWQLKKGKPNGPGWAIAASTINVLILLLGALVWLRFHNPRTLPIYLFCGMTGVLGLLAFWRQESSPPPLPKKVIRIAGDGTSKVKDYVGVGVSIAIIWVGSGWVDRWSIVHHLPHSSLVPFAIKVQLAILLSTLGHELGHFIAGWASGMILRSFCVGPARWAVRNGKWRFDFNLRRFYGGAVEMVAPNLFRLRSNTAFFIIGGPFGSLVTGAIFAVLTLTAPGSSWQPYWEWLAMMAVFSFAGFIVNLIPQKPESQYSDGAQLYQIMTNGPWAKVHLAFAMVTTSLVTAVRPRDFDLETLIAAADSVPEGDRGLLLRLFTSQRYLDAGRIPEGLAYMEAGELLYEHSVLMQPADICAEFLFMNAFYKQNLSTAAIWEHRIETLPKVDKDADYWLARTALLWLKGEHVAADDAWSKGVALAEDLPACGAYEYTRSRFRSLRTALDDVNEPAQPPEDLGALAAACDPVGWSSEITKLKLFARTTKRRSKWL